MKPNVFASSFRSGVTSCRSNFCRSAPAKLPLRIVVSCVFAASIGLAAESKASDSLSTESLKHFFRDHCIGCHGESGEVNGEVDLLKAANSDALDTDAELLGELIKVIEFGEMPPEGEPELTPEVRDQILGLLQSRLQKVVAATRPFDQAPIRRMNRFQYNNAVTDLFELNCVVFTLPERMMREHRNYFRPETGRMPDRVTVGSRPLGKSQLIEQRLAGVTPFPQDLRAEHGFDNRGDHLSLSPLLMQSFLKLARSITESPDFTPERVGIWNEFFAAPRIDGDAVPTVRRRLSKFLTRAFRRPVDESTLDRYTRFVEAKIAGGHGFTEAMKSAAAAAIASPRFLYLYDQANRSDGRQPLDDHELASRLSFFLWGSLPDERLLELAAANELNDPEVLIAEVDRMLRDQKLKRFCDSFPAQWLQLDRIISSVPDRDKYAGFYFSKYRNSMHMMLEPLLLFETVLIENQSILQFLDSDFTYRSVRLREAYGENVSANDRKRQGSTVTALNFQRLPVKDRRFGGLITNAAVLTMTSGRQRTKPITRGAWMASVIFNDPPDPPPADVPPLAERRADDEKLTLRERLNAHRERADCRGCHEQIDPLGFALENYDAIGRWRDRYENGREVDSAGTLFRRHPFDSVVEFKDALLAEKDRFTEAFVGHLMSFALARELKAADALEVKRIAEATAADDYRIQTAIKQIVLSAPFLSKRTPERANHAND